MSPELPPARTLSKLPEWQEYLTNIDGVEVRRLLKHLHDERDRIFKPFYKTKGIPRIDDFVNAVATKEKESLTEFNGYANNYNWATRPSTEKENSARLKTIAIEAILYLYSKYGNVDIQPETNLVTNGDPAVQYHINPIPEQVVPNPESAKPVSYVFYYWKSSGIYETHERVSSSLLEINYDKGTAELTDRHGRQLEGHLTVIPALHEGTTVSIVLGEKDKDHKLFRRGQSLSIFFYRPADEGYQDHYWGSYAKERTLSNGEVSYGTVYLERCEDTHHWKTINASAAIQYLLRKKRFNLAAPSRSGKTNESDYPHRDIQEYVGIYEGYLIRLTKEESSLNKFFLALREDGSAIQYTHLEHNFPQKVYAGQFKLISKQGLAFLVIDHDFNLKDKESDYQKFMRFRFILKKGSIWQTHKETADCLLGTRIGAPYSDRNYPISTKVCLRKLNSPIRQELRGTEEEKEEQFKKLLDVFFDPLNATEQTDSESPEQAIFRRYMDQLQSIPITGPKVDENQLIKFFDEHEYLKTFLFHPDYQSYTGRHSVNLIEKLLPVDVPSGDFECYSFTLKDNKPILSYDDAKEALIVKYPIRIQPNGKALIRVIDQTYQGKAIYNAGRQELMINFFRNNIDAGENSLMSCLFNINGGEDGTSKLPERIPGVMIKAVRGETLSEGRVCVLQQSTTPFGDNEYDTFFFDSFRFRRLDRAMKGALSHLAGPINRIARSVKSLNKIAPRQETTSLKNDLFYAACYLALQNAPIKDIKDRLFQAYIHGFAQTHFRGKSAKDHAGVQYFDSLLKEQEQLTAAIATDGPLKHKELVDHVNELWFKLPKKAEFRKLIGLAENEKVTILIPSPSGMTDPSDEKAGEVVQELLDYYEVSTEAPLPAYSQADPVYDKSLSYIAIGLLSNPFVNQINDEQDWRKAGRYFKLVKNEEQKRLDIKLIKSLRKLRDTEADWIYTPHTDYAVFAKVNVGERKALIIGGRYASGTEQLAEYLAIHWERVMQLKDEDTGVPLIDSQNFVCLFSLTGTDISDEVVRASKKLV